VSSRPSLPDLAELVADLKQRVRILEANPSGSGILFDTDPQSGDWLEITATGNNSGDDGVGIRLRSTQADAGTGSELNSLDADIQLITLGNGSILLDTALGTNAQIVLSSDGDGGLSIKNSGAGGLNMRDTGGGGFNFQTFDDFFFHISGGNFIIQALPTSDPGVTNALWNNGGVVTVS
jgi:hypothetical protein